MLANGNLMTDNEDDSVYTKNINQEIRTLYREINKCIKDEPNQVCEECSQKLSYIDELKELLVKS